MRFLRFDMDAWAPVYISCTNLKSMDQFARLEAELGPPVISSNAATLWIGLRRMGVLTPRLPLGRLYDLEPSWTICPRAK